MTGGEKAKRRVPVMPGKCSKSLATFFWKNSPPPPSILGRLSPLRYSSVKYQVSQIEKKKCLLKDSYKKLEYFLRAGELNHQSSQNAIRLRYWCTKDLYSASVFPLSGPGKSLCKCKYSVSLSPCGEVYVRVGLVPSIARTQLREF